MKEINVYVVELLCDSKSNHDIYIYIMYVAGSSSPFLKKGISKLRP